MTSFDSSRAHLDVDVVVVGAGIIGASCALQLAARGLRVAILEARSAPAEGSTGGSVAAVRAQWTDAVNAEQVTEGAMRSVNVESLGLQRFGSGVAPQSILFV